ncbi:Putative Holin-X, holin superfamily III [Mesonia phycicola]|uniref:Putative Holin-X, holin superfamily III n=1 Tax=Mesonia phycicola TaxID=579105 RepID=A0A1M6D424_9FLAO|nr:phage holin family protein [Mesonia phycicola]SHI67949.1 Putative Holin-X, holin superfamily III [Mesonia phycicola]
MAFKDISNHINDLNDNIQAYIDSMLEYYKLEAFKNLTKGSSQFIKLIVFGSIFLIFLAFVSIGLALLIGKALENFALGFFIMGGFFLFVFILLIVFGSKLIDKMILKEFSKMLFNKSTVEEVVESSLKDEIDS